MVVEGKELVDTLTVLVLQLAAILHVLDDAIDGALQIVFHLAEAIPFIIEIAFNIYMFTCHKSIIIKQAINNRLS